MARNPFDDSLLASASDDAKVESTTISSLFAVNRILGIPLESSGIFHFNHRC
jgi:hypothetical protein